MPEELRVAFHRDLQTIDDKVVQLFALVSEGLAAATDAFLAGDRQAGKALVARDSLIDSLYRDAEGLVQSQFARQSPMASDLRYLLSVLRVVPELERSGDLAEHIAARAVRGIATELPPRVRGLVQQMGRIGVEMWRQATDVWIERDVVGARAVAERDDELDELHVSLIAEVSSGVVSVPLAMEMALVGRFYERLGDHAANIAARVVYIVAGDDETRHVDVAAD